MIVTTKRTLSATPNHKNRTFTLRVSPGTKYRTTKMDKEEFQSCLHNTENDWFIFLSSSQDYYPI